MNNLSMENETEIYKRMVVFLRNDATNAMTAAAEFKARLEIATEENERLKKELAAVQKKPAAAAAPAKAAN